MPIFGLISIIFNNSTHPRSPMDVANATNINKHLNQQQISAIPGSIPVLQLDCYLPSELM